MRTRVLAAVMSVVLLGSGSGQAQPSPAGLSGTWERDKTRSDAVARRGQTAADAEITMVIEQRAPTVSIKRVLTMGSDRVVRQLTYTTDGKENKNLNARGSEVRSRSTWDGGRLVTKGSQTMDSPLGKVDAAVNETWTLSPDGRTLTIEATTTIPVAGELKRKEVFVRKS
jgi:hypothetical protein